MSPACDVQARARYRLLLRVMPRQLRDAVVMAREDEPGERRLVAYCVGDEGADVESLRAHLAERPDYSEAFGGVVEPEADHERKRQVELTSRGRLTDR